MKKLGLLFFLSLALSLGMAQATGQQAPSNKDNSATAEAAHIDPAKEADIRRLLEIAGTKAMMQQLMGSMEGNIKPLITSALPPGDYREELVEKFFDKFHRKLDLNRLLDFAVVSYDKHFTGEEIKELIAFYSTPLGKKALTVLPQLVTEMQEKSRAYGRDLGRDAMTEVLQENPDLKAKLEAAAKTQQQR